jgi:hypothetical protein
MAKWDEKSGVDQEKAKAVTEGILKPKTDVGPGFVQAIKNVFAKPNTQYPNKKQRGYGQNS